MENGLLLPLYAAACLKYAGGYFLFSGIRVRMRGYLPGLMLCSVLLFVPLGIPDMTDRRLLVRLAAMLTTLLLIKGSPGKKLYTFLILGISLEALTEFFDVLICGVARQEMTNAENLLVDMFCIAGLLCYSLLQKHLGDEKGALLMKRLLPFFTVVAGIVLMFVIELIAYMAARIGVPWFRPFARIASLIGAFGIMAAMWTAVYIYRTNEKLALLLKREAEYTKVQEDYFENLLERETMTRRYRHDMTNHLLCLKALSEEEEAAGVTAYLDDLLRTLKSAGPGRFHTGVRVLDALTDYYTGKLDSGITITVTGTLRSCGGISDRDLCTIYGNLLSNATEELGGLHGSGRQLCVRLQEGGKFLVIAMENTCRTELSYDSAGRIMTRKKNRREHGFGLANVRDCVERLGGSLTLSRSGEHFCAEVALPLKEF